MNFDEMNTGSGIDPKDFGTVGQYDEKESTGDFDDLCLTGDCKKKKKTKDEEYVCPKEYPNLRSFKDSGEWWCYKGNYDGPGCNVKTHLSAPNKGSWGKNSNYSTCK